jgi:NADH-quinone oxidoreductase subunit J
VIETALLYLFAASSLAGAALMLVLRHPLRVALALITTMLSLAGVYAVLGVHVIAVFQVLIYVGAVMVFMVYVIMLLELRDRTLAHRYSALLVPGLAGFALLVGALVLRLSPAATGAPGAADGTPYGVRSFSIAFLNDYWLHFELVSVLLVAAVVAAIAVLKVGSGDRG